MDGPQQLGQQAENLALQHLQQQGLTLVARNQRYRMGELDLIMRDTSNVGAAALVFVEVRFRRSRRYGGAAASVTPRKQQRLIRAADFFLQQHPHWRDAPCRFDVVALAPSSAGWTVDWIRAAFTT